MTVALAELAMQRIVVPRGEILYAGSSPVGHQFAFLLIFCYNYYRKIKREVIIMTKIKITIRTELDISRKDFNTEEEYDNAVQRKVEQLDLNVEDLIYEYEDEDY